MIGYRKIILGVVFLLCATFLGWRGMEGGTPMMDLATVIGAMAGGTFGVVWGNVRAKEQKNGE